jgi:hypothetical protein
VYYVAVTSASEVTAKKISAIGTKKNIYLDVISKIPGWLRGRRYELISATDLTAKADKNAPAPPKYLLVHECDRPDFASHTAVQDTAKTPLAQRSSLGRIIGVSSYTEILPQRNELNG